MVNDDRWYTKPALLLLPKGHYCLPVAKWNDLPAISGLAGVINPSQTFSTKRVGKPD
jgi:hypothetical protein